MTRAEKTRLRAWWKNSTKPAAPKDTPKRLTRVARAYR
jgi:hypothetical protein